jgi:hypothetical protein
MARGHGAQPAGLEAHLGIVDPSRERGLWVGPWSTVYRTCALSALLLKNGLRSGSGSRLIVDPAPGQGAIYCFEEIR